VELALERYDQALLGQDLLSNDFVWDLAAEDWRNIAPGNTSTHDEFFDENCLPT
jgi:antitoxin VapB